MIKFIEAPTGKKVFFLLPKEYHRMRVRKDGIDTVSYIEWLDWYLRKQEEEGRQFYIIPVVDPPVEILNEEEILLRENLDF